MAVTMKEVAQAAGVSTAAVSKVLHGSGASVRVSAETAGRIRAAARQLSYVPNALARSLRSSRTQTVGVVFENLSGFSAGPLYTMLLLDGICSVLFQRHYRLTVLTEFDHNDILGSLGDGRLDGVIWCKLVRDETTSLALQDCPIPIVAMNAPLPSLPTDTLYVSCDNAGGIEMAVEHLWALGHRDILFMREVEEVETPDCADRLAAFEAAMAAHGKPAGPNDVVAWDWHLKQFAEWWATQPPHTAIIGWSERCAGLVLSRCAEMGISVPDQLSVVGFDSTQYCDSTRPRLTAVKQPISEMASAAARMLLEMLAGDSVDQTSHIYPCQLDERDSTAPPRS